MKAENFPSRLAMPMPFANNSDALTTILDSQDSSGSAVNFADGFPSAYSSPKSNGGKFVTRGEINALGNLASRNDFYRMCGGLNIFNQEFAKKIGGYANGAILEYLTGGVVRRVISLKDDNLVDFTSPGTTLDGIISGSVDNINWAYCENELPDGRMLILEYETGRVPFNPNQTDMQIYAGTLRASGYLSAQAEFGKYTNEGASSASFAGFMAAYKLPGESEFRNWWLAWTGDLQVQPSDSSGALFLPAGTILVVWFRYATTEIENTKLKVFITP